MKITFLGTRGGIIARSPLHYMHSVILIEFRKTALLIDWGLDWLDIKAPAVDGLLVTHAHPDHAGGLAHGFPAPVYASAETLAHIKRYPLENSIAIKPRTIVTIGSLTIEPFAVYHSLISPALGFRITGGKRSLFYAPDLISIIDERDALSSTDLYIGDGAIITRKLLMRVKEGVPIGHSTVKNQLEWCQHYSIPHAIITHCGSEIVKHPESTTLHKMSSITPKGVTATIAYDGMLYTF